MIDSIFTYEFPKEEIEAFNYLSSIDDPNAYLMLEAMYKKAEKPRFRSKFRVVCPSVLRSSRP